MLHASIDALLTNLPDGQAGGGGLFGEGRGGGGGSGDGDGVFTLFYFLIRLAFEVPILGVPLLIVAVIVFVRGSQRGWWKHQERVVRRERPRLRTQASARHTEVLRARDPDFDESRFLERARLAFEMAQQGWCDQDLTLLQNFVSDGVFERFSMQIEEQREDGWRQEMVGLKAGRLAILDVHSGRHFDTVTVQIPFTAKIRRLDLKTNQPITGSELSRTTFAECWSFVRRRSASSRRVVGLIEGQCPNCGAPLRMNQSARCDSCEAFVRSGEFDWVLTEITQSSEWRAHGEDEIAGVAQYAQRDPGISVQLLEDRASVAFWRKVAADRRGIAAPLARVADAEFCASYAERLRAPEDRERLYLAENAVGSVRTLGIVAGEELDRAVVEILFDGCRAHVTQEGRRVVEESRQLQRALYVFARPAGAQTKLEESFSTTICRNCGAHDLGGLDPLCPYCAAPRTGPAWVWLLHEIVVDRTAAAHSLRAELAQAHASSSRREPVRSEPALRVAQVSSADLLGWVTAMVRADGALDPKERAALQTLARRQGVSEARLEEMLQVSRDSSDAPAPRDTYEARDWLYTLAQLALADGSMQKGEMRFLKHCASQLGVGALELERIVNRARTELYRAARSARE